MLSMLKKSKFSKVRIFKIDFTNFVPHIEKQQKTQKKNILALKKHRFLDPKKHKFSKKALNDVFLSCFLLFLSQKLSQKALVQGKLMSGNRFPVLFFGFGIIQMCFGGKIEVFYTPKMTQKFVFPEPGLEKFFHASKMRAIDSPTRKTLIGSKISSKIDFYNQISTF